MNARWLTGAIQAAVLAVGLGLACSQGPESPASSPDLDTLRAALAERDELERVHLLTSYLRTMGPEDVEPALEEIEKRRAGFDKEEVRLLMFAWTRFDAPGAFETAKNWRSPWRSVLLEEAAHAWGFRDGWAALEAIQQIQNEELQKTLIRSLLEGWVSGHDRQGASEYVATLTPPQRRARMTLRLAGQAKRDGPDAIIAWVEAVPEDAPNQYKETAFGFGAGALAAVDPERAASWYESHMKDWYSTSGLSSMAGKWVYHHDPKSYVEWIETLSIEEARESERTDGLRIAFRDWAEEASEEVEAWLEANPGSPARDSAIDELAREAAKNSPAEALRWAEQIEDEDLRRRRMLRYSRRWFAEDPLAARAWIDEADVPPGFRRQIRDNWPSGPARGVTKNAESDG